ncbi:MAG: hypothetical protein DLM64_09665 [Solirubrobacterales bacterium]|nr:MAG: hypothetical protein DLM64_09665 [Solirubrobacterales bacterium]
MFPPNPFDTEFDRVLTIALMLLLWGYALLLLVRFLGRRRPTLAVGGGLAFGYVLRVLAIAGVTASGIGSSLRGGDEVLFLKTAHQIAASSLSSSAWLPFGHNGLYEIVFALQLRLGELTVDTMRITEVGLAMIGTALVVVAVHDLVGARASRLAAWLLAIEPASVFFSQVLHKEPFMMLATGLVVFGGAKLWRRLSVGGLMIMGAGGAIAVATRPYAGWLLISAAVFLAMHAAVRNLEQRGRAVSILCAVVAVVAVATPVILHATSKQSLQNNLQVSQNANAAAAGTAGNSLALEQVNLSTRGQIITNLPTRISDLLLRPYVWQVRDPSQRLGVLGTLVAYAALYMFGLYAVRLRWRSFDTAAPLLYPLLLLLVAYSLSVGNAGTGFRYRTQLVILLIPTVLVLRERWLAITAERRSRAGATRRPGASPRRLSPALAAQERFERQQRPQGVPVVAGATVVLGRDPLDRGRDEVLAHPRAWREQPSP